MVALFVMKDARVADKVSDMVRSSAPDSARLIVNDKLMVVYAAARVRSRHRRAERDRGAVAAPRAPPPDGARGAHRLSLLALKPIFGAHHISRPQSGGGAGAHKRLRSRPPTPQPPKVLK